MPQCQNTDSTNTFSQRGQGSYTPTPEVQCWHPGQYSGERHQTMCPPNHPQPLKSSPLISAISTGRVRKEVAGSTGGLTSEAEACGQITAQWRWGHQGHACKDSPLTGHESGRTDSQSPRLMGILPNAKWSSWGVWPHWAHVDCPWMRPMPPATRADSTHRHYDGA